MDGDETFSPLKMLLPEKKESSFQDFLTCMIEHASRHIF